MPKQCDTTRSVQRSTGDGARPLLSSVLIELGVAAAVFGLYRAGRMLTRASEATARGNAQRVIDFEESLGLFSERAVQQWTLHSHWLVEFLNRYYVYAHFPVTVTFLVWLFVFRRDSYRQIRNWFAAVTMAALVIHVAYPLAPPRMTAGFVDTLRVYGPAIYTRDATHSLANQFAAMPSLHFGWALMVGLSVHMLTRVRLSVALIHPALILVSIVATGNHYWLDATVAFALVLAMARLVRVWEPQGYPTPARRGVHSRTRTGALEPSLACSDSA